MEIIMIKYFLSVLFLFTGFQVNAGIIVQDFDPSASYSDPYWVHDFGPISGTIIHATIEVSNQSLGYYEYDADPLFGLYGDGEYLGTLMDCDPDNDAEADMDPSCVGSVGTDFFVLSDYGNLYDGTFNMYISAHPWDGWNTTRSTLTITTADVPEPTTLAILGLGLAGLSFTRRKTQI